MLIERNLRLVVYIARKFENTGIHIEDLVSIGTIGLIKAVNTFDPRKKSSWPPMLPGVSKMKSSCISAETIKCALKSHLMNPSISTGMGMSCCCPMFLGTENDTIYRNIEDQVDRKILRIALANYRSGNDGSWSCALDLMVEKRRHKRMWPIFGYFSIVYFPAGKENYKAATEGI